MATASMRSTTSSRKAVSRNRVSGFSGTAWAPISRSSLAASRIVRSASRRLSIDMKTPMKTVGIVGARGHTGAELVRLIAAHPSVQLTFVSSRELDGQRVDADNDAYAGELRDENLDPQAVVAKRADVVILALPNGRAAPFVEAVDQSAPDTLVVDLSVDYRFDRTWYYGLPELTRDKWRGERRISNPGCYATAIELTL